MQVLDDQPQSGEHRTALATLAHMPVHARAPTCRQIPVEVFRHVWRRPTVVAPEPRPRYELTH
jgi:hypothetical protein